ncbi:hypothetical protein [Streptomyces sp. NPDC008122]|uniref:hypothetical protein n=1 Tax=Streptomyces sp. NPDC008122 TaxID=3364810 RepID=UPI0036E192CD
MPGAGERYLGSPFGPGTTATAVLDHRDDAIGWDGAAQALYGYAPDEVLGKPARAFLVPVDGRPLFDPDRPGGSGGEKRALRRLDGIVASGLPARARDGIALLLVRVHALAEDDMAGWRIDPGPAKVAGGRASTNAQPEHWGLDAVGFAVELIVSELATNAIRYGPRRSTCGSCATRTAR